MRDRRKTAAIRKSFQEISDVVCKDLIMPIFVKEGILKKKEISSMPGIYQFSLKDAVKEARKIYGAGIPSVILFGIPLHKDDTGASAYDAQGIVQLAIRAIKKAVPGLKVIVDVCMCEYTSHGHCGIIKQSTVHRPQTTIKNKKHVSCVDNDETIKVLAKIALSYVQAGADVVAPSAMMDFQVRAIKKALVENKYREVKIMSYSSKFASSFYGPFRDAAESPPQFGDRKAYQMDYHNSDEAVLEAKLDIKEGADIVMVKPAFGYQDIIYRLKKELKFPLACYSVSGEYAMIKAASIRGWIDEKKIVLEALTGFKRAGADFIITYYALEAAKWMLKK